MKIRELLYLGIIGTMMINGCADKTTQEKDLQVNMIPPVAAKRPYDVTIHGDTRVDNYFWLRERDNPEVLEYLNAENDYTDAMMKHTEEFQEFLFQEMKGRIKETDLSVPVKIDNYYYYDRTEEGKQYSIHCRKKNSLDAPEEILLDENQLAEGYEFFRLGVFEISPDHSILAYATDTTGGEEFTLNFKNLETGQLYRDQISAISYSLEWANDNKTVFYSTQDEAKRADKIFRHSLGSPVSQDHLIVHESDDAYSVSMGKSKDKKYLFLEFESNITTEVRFLDANQPMGEFKMIEPRREGIEYFTYHHGEDFYILTNENALNFKLMKAPVANPGTANWQTVIAYRPETKLEDIDLFADHLVVYEKENGLERINIRNLVSGKQEYLSFDEEVYSLSGNSNPDFNTNILRYTYSSMITPQTVYDYNMDTKEREMKKQDEVLGGYNPENYVTKRLWAKADDGTLIPMSVMYKKGMRRNGRNPLFLYGYGSYGATINAYFSHSRLSLVDRGMIYVIAHIRGSGYLGRPWYEDGKLLHKKNTFSDFINCAEYLVQKGYTNPKMLAVSGGSAGGLLMGAVTNIRPDLFKVVVARVPFVDVINTMLDETIPLTVPEFDEWGNPKEKTYYDYMITYSPYDNVSRRDYPNLLVTAGLNDARVQYWEPAKWVAKLRALKTDHNLLLLKTNMGAGHAGPSGRYEYLRETAFYFAFIIDRLGLPLK